MGVEMKVAVLITGQLRDYKINYTNHLKQLIQPNKADVFVYACTKNTIHTLGNGSQLNQKYILTNEVSEGEIKEEVSNVYGEYLKDLVVDSNEKLPTSNFGTLGYFRQRMQNQIDNIGKGFELAKKYAKNNNFEYDIFVRCRPDNSMYLRQVNLLNFKCSDNTIYSTKFSSGHRDLCFFGFGDKESFEKYCSYEYMKGADPNSTANPPSTEHSWEIYLASIGVKTKYIVDICKPFTGFDKTEPIVDFPFRNKEELLIDSNGNFVKQVEP
tara:strand:- start:5586 stop:6392 length:807 start_codon:yes stop_codon:yes gene_type:complete